MKLLRKWWMVVFAMVMVTFPMIAFAQEAGEGSEDTFGSLVKALMDAIQGDSPQKGILISAAVISLFMWILKTDKKPFSLVPKPPKDWNVWIVLGLGMASGILNAILGGENWVLAIVTGLLSAAASGYGYDLYRKGQREKNEGAT